LKIKAFRRSSVKVVKEKMDERNSISRLKETILEAMFWFEKWTSDLFFPIKKIQNNKKDKHFL